MNYYQHHIGDYMRDTAHLTALEDGLYRRALDWYYANEKPLPLDMKQVCRYLRARDKSEIAAVEVIISEFFKAQDDGFHQNRCDTEIAEYNAKAETNRVNGKKGGRPKKENTETQTKGNDNPKETQSVISGLNTETQTKGNQEPRTINQEPIKNTLSQSASQEFEPDLKLVNTKLKMSGMVETNQIELNQILVQFNLKNSHLDKTDNQKLGSLLTWFKNERQPPKTTRNQAQPKLDVNAAWALQPKNDTPLSLEEQARIKQETLDDPEVYY